MADWQGTYPVTVGTEEQMSAVTERLSKREEERQAQIQKRRQEESEQQTFKVQESVKLFLDAFKAERLDLEEQLAKSKSVEASNLITHFDNLSLRVSKLQRYVSESAMFLPPYDLKTAQNFLTSLQTKIHEKREELIPKKKFSFKPSNRKTDKRPLPVSCSLKSEETAKDSNSGDDIVLELAACKFVDISNRTLQKNRNEINKKDIALANLTDCTVVLYGAPSAIHMNKLKNCKVFCGPVPGSIFIRECTNCTFNLSCQQLRIHSTTNSYFYIHVTSKAIVEDCSDVKFAPCTWTYEGQDEDYASSGLSRERNNWDSVDDFNWLAADVHSPNWSILEESERIHSWNI
ncbi:tubulin-specific chaperone C [Biomphalaria glabrata]|nr:tubulin-specific chaperone C [Biomphalaria glabrata]